MSMLTSMMAPLHIARAGLGFYRLLRDPSRLEEVFQILDKLEQYANPAEIVREWTDDPGYAQVFIDRPRLGVIDLDALAMLPPGSLGRTFADEMRARDLDPADIQQRKDDGTKAGYALLHIRETHDLWHTLTGFEVDVAGELGLQAVYLGQFKAKLAMVLLGGGFLNTAFFASDDRVRRMDAIVRGWHIGRRARMFGFDYAKNWSMPLAEVRAKLGIDVAQSVERREPNIAEHATLEVGVKHHAAERQQVVPHEVHVTASIVAR